MTGGVVLMKISLSGSLSRLCEEAHRQGSFLRLAIRLIGIAIPAVRRAPCGRGIRLLETSKTGLRRGCSLELAETRLCRNSDTGDQ